MRRTMTRPKIKDCIPLINGIWTHIDYQFPEIFDITPSQLDVMFLSNWSMRTAAPILHLLHDDEDTTMLTQEELITLGAMINGLYKHKWDKLMDVATQEYDPIHNYFDHLVEGITYSEENDGSKSGIGSHSETRTDNLTRTETDRKGYTDTYNTSDTETHDTRETETNNLQNQQSNNLQNQQTDARQITENHNMNNSGSTSDNRNIFGFNSSTAVGDSTGSGTNSNLESGSITTTHSGTLTDHKTGTVTDTKTGTVTDAKTGTVTDAKTGTVARVNNGTLTTQDTGTQGNIGSNTNSETSSNDTSGERTREYTKNGNIGNISTQKLMNEEIDLWRYNFIYEMMKDVVGMISLPIYEQ